MRVKKLNTAIAALAVAGAGAWWTFGGWLTSAPADLASQTADLAGQMVDTATNPGDAAGTFRGEFSEGARDIVSEDDFSPLGKQVQTITWNNGGGSLEQSLGQMPFAPTLQKWTVGNRTFYQMTGPINRDFINRPRGGWGSHLAYEAYFLRDGLHHDHWVIGPPGGFIGHYSRPTEGDPGYYNPLGYSTIPASRYRMNPVGDQVTVTFWCYSHNTPGNIVFNYNVPGGGIAWVATGRDGGGAAWENHRHVFWTNP